MKFKYFLTSILATAFLNLAKAEPFDKTGLIDLKNEATKRASCFVIGSRLELVTTAIWSDMRGKPAKTQDEQWANEKKATEVLDFGKTGSFWAKKLNENISQAIPPSQMQDYFTTQRDGMSKFDLLTKKDPWLGVNAWNACGKSYGFFK